MGIVESGCFQTTWAFVPSGRATIISPTPRLNQSIIPMLLYLCAVPRSVDPAATTRCLD